MKKYGILLVKSLVGCVFLAFTLFPIVLLISSSLKIDTEVFDYRIIPKHITLDAYKQVFRILDIFTGIRNSLFVATMVTVLALIVHSMAAFAFARLEFPGKKGAFMWVLSTMMIPFPVIIIPLFRMHMAYSFLGNTLWKCRILCMSQPESMDVRYFRLLEKYMSRLQSPCLLH